MKIQHCIDGVTRFAFDAPLTITCRKLLSGISKWERVCFIENAPMPESVDPDNPHRSRQLFLLDSRFSKIATCIMNDDVVWTFNEEQMN